jgi:hypothetical protein
MMRCNMKNIKIIIKISSSYDDKPTENFMNCLILVDGSTW